jgi:hypothetical protein
LQDDEKLARFLGTAARLFLFAVLQVEGMDLPIINLGPDPWIVALDGLPDMKIMPPPPTEWILRVLGEYRAPADQK